ncbi:MAG: PLP-dependent cysteine synthase family protein, partial [Planctomycetota bacterium]
GIALAMVGAMKGYDVRIRMPATVSEERRHMIRSFGAKLELFDAINRIAQVVEETEAEMAERDDVFLTRQFANEDNALCHEKTTGPEILTQTGGRFDAFVMGVGTGGTVMGVGRALRNVGHKARVVAVEPDESAVMSGDSPGCHGIQGLADGFIPPIVDVNSFHSVVRVPTEEAKNRSALLGKEEGLLVGISAGANVIAAERVAMELGPGHTVVTVLCDRGERYLSMRESVKALHPGETGVPSLPDGTGF